MGISKLVELLMEHMYQSLHQLKPMETNWIGEATIN